MPTHVLPMGVERAAVFRADDRILLGEGLFETIRVDGQKPCYPLMHWQRMREAALELQIPFDVSEKTWVHKIAECLSVCHLHQGGVKVILSGGPASRGLTTSAETSFLSFEAFPYATEQQAACLVSSAWARDAKNPIYRFKSVNYLESIVARRLAENSGADDALFFNLDQFATETTTANLFVVKQDKVSTPLLSDGILAGITRARLLQLCLDQGIICVERPVTHPMIVSADAVFLTNALQGIRLVESFDGHSLPTDHPLVFHLRQCLDGM